MRIVLHIVLMLFLMLPSMAGAGEKVWRAAYVEGGPYYNFQHTLAGTARGLDRLGLIRTGAVTVPENSTDASGMWQWLSEHNRTLSHIEFVADAFYSAGWDSARREEIRRAVADRVRRKKDIDLVITMGTWAGYDIASQHLGIPVFCMSVTDAVDAGIIKCADDSGDEFLHAQVEPGRFTRQLTLFHEIFKFKTLGVPYEDTQDGRSTAGILELRNAAEDLGFTLVEATAPLDVPDPKLAAANLEKCLDELRGRADAIYLTCNSIPMPDIARLIAPINKAGIPTFAQAGPESVRYGVLMSLGQTNFNELGLFEAKAIGKVLSGTSPRDVDQVFEPELGLVLNLKAAMILGWTPPLDVLASVEEIFRTIRTK